VDEALLRLLVCPGCKGPLSWRPQTHELVCLTERLAFPVRDGLPVLLADEARPLADPEEVA
jgi:uncharacterized protein YbaR (Trm112 family)